MTTDLLTRVLPLYGLPADTPLTLLNRSENETWRAGDLILRLHRQGYHTRAEIASELDWLTALQDLPGLRAVRPVAGQEGMVTQIDGRFVVGFARIAGQELQPGDDLSRWFAPLGEIIALVRADLDLSDAVATSATLDKYQPDIIVNPAAYTAVDKAESDVDLAYAVNAQAAGVMARWAQKHGAMMIHYSTDYVFDGSGTHAHVETDPVAPLGVYGKTKLDGENAIRAVLPDHLIMRTAWVYSPFGRNFVKTMLKLAETRAELNVVADQHGNPTSAFDIADAIVAVLKEWLGGRRSGLGETYHVAGTGEAVWADLAECVLAESAALSGPTMKVNRITTDQYPTKARRPVNSRLDCAKFEHAFGWRAPRWQTSAREVVTRILAEA